MTSISFHSAPGTTANPRRGETGRRRGLIEGLLRWWDRRAAIKALHRLDDRELKDIGLTRDRIETAVSGITRAESELGRFR